MIEMIVETDTVNTVSHLIALSVAPVFLLASVSGLLGVFSGRLSRIIDRFDKIDALLVASKENSRDHAKLEKLNKQRRYIERRANNMNRGIFFCTATGILVAFSIITIFMSVFFVFESSLLIAVLFVTGMLCLVTALALFLREVFMATRFLKRDRVY